MDALALLLPVLACLPQEGSEQERTIEVGETVSGELSPDDPVLAGRGPSLRFVLFAEQCPVTITLDSFDFDAFLRAEDSAGALLAEDDDGGVETNARVVLPALAEGSCWIIASSKGGSGPFELSTREGDHPLPTGTALRDAAIVFRSTAAERALARGDRRAAAAHRLQEGIRWSECSQFLQAKGAFESSYTLFAEVGDREGEVWALGNLGYVYFSLGDFAKALEHLERTLARSREIGHRPLEAKALATIGAVYVSLGQYASALEHLERSLALARESGDRDAEMRALGNLGATLHELGDYARARELHEAHLALAREIGSHVEEARAIGNLGNVHRALGDLARARDLHEQHLSLARELGDRAGEARAIGNLGTVHGCLGDYAQAREHHEQHLALARELGDRPGEALAIGHLGNVACLLGDYAKARELHEQHLALARELGDRAGEARALGNMGWVHGLIGDYARARGYHEQHLALARELGDRAGEARAIGNIGVASFFLGDFARARDHHEQHLALAREIGDRSGEARALVNLAKSHCLDDPERARELTSMAEALALEVGNQEERVHALWILLRADMALEDGTRAVAALSEAERVIDELAGVPGDRGEASGLRSRFGPLSDAAQSLCALLVRQASEGEDREEAARLGFAASGRWKGRVLLEGIAEHRSGGRSAEAIRLRREWREALASRQALLERVSTAIHDGRSLEEVEALREEARGKLAQAEELGGRLREASPRDAALDLPLGASPEELRSAVLGPRDALVEYAEGEERLYAYVLDAAGLEFLDLGSRGEIGLEVERFLAGIRGGLAGPAEIGRTGRALFERLLAPALSACDRPIERLVIVPTGDLAALPFEALVVQGSSAEPATVGELTFVLDRYEVTYGPSSPVLVELASLGPREGSGKVLLIADPRYASEPEDEPADAPPIALLGEGGPRALPDPKSLERLPKTREEALAVAELLVGTEDPEAALGLMRLHQERSGSHASARFDLHLGTAATRERLAGDLRRYAVLHLACHGFVDPEFPQRTGLALAFGKGDEGWFTIGDALELDLDANLVVLSACETARGEAVAGEGIESLARAFLYSGARGVVASLWQVEDWAAAETMQGFYRGALEQGLPPARALREAKLAMRRSSSLRGRGVPVASGEAPPMLESSHPYFWAPFIHIGLAR